MSSKLAFAEELLSDLITEIVPLFKAHRDEVSVLADVPLDPDWDTYFKLEKAGVLSLFTARDQAGALVGYVAFMVHRNLHYNIISADQDVLYLRPEARKGLAAMQMIKFAEKALKARSVKIITQHSKMAKDLTGLLSYMGYTVMDQIHYKRL